MLFMHKLLADVSASPSTNYFAAARLTIHTPSCTYCGPLPGGHMGPDPPPSARPKPCEINDSLIAVRPAHMTLCLHVKTCHDPMCVTPGVSLSTRQLWLSTWVGGLAMATHKAVRLLSANFHPTTPCLKTTETPVTLTSVQRIMGLPDHGRTVVLLTQRLCLSSSS